MGSVATPVQEKAERKHTLEYFLIIIGTPAAHVIDLPGPLLVAVVDGKSVSEVVVVGLGVTA